MKRSIFIVEDNEDIGYILDYHLSGEGFAVKLFQNISTFYMTYPTDLPDLFLLDVMLPDGDGLKLCREIKDNNRSQIIPIIIMSAHAPAQTLYKEACANDFIQKPFDLSEVSRKINSLLKDPSDVSLFG